MLCDSNVHFLSLSDFLFALNRLTTSQCLDLSLSHCGHCLSFKCDLSSSFGLSVSTIGGGGGGRAAFAARKRGETFVSVSEPEKSRIKRSFASRKLIEAIARRLAFPPV